VSRQTVRAELVEALVARQERFDKLSANGMQRFDRLSANGVC
jgi:hypothetical protein